MFPVQCPAPGACSMPALGLGSASLFLSQAWWIRARIQRCQMIFSQFLHAAFFFSISEAGRHLPRSVTEHLEMWWLALPREDPTGL